MSEDKSSPILAPTYQTVLINALNTTVTRMLNEEPEGTFQALRTLHSILKTEMQKFIKASWEKYLSDKEKIRVEGVSFARRSINYQRAIRNFLYRRNPEIMQEFIKTLDKFGYLTKEWQPLSSKDFKGMPGETGQ